MISTSEIEKYLNLARREYMNQNPAGALAYTAPILALYHNIDIQNLSEQECLHILDAFTLHQSCLSLLHRPAEYLRLESNVEELISLSFSEHISFYYALHLFDVCEHMAVNHFLSEARFYSSKAIDILLKEFGPCPYISFMDYICNSMIAFYMEDYYSCIEHASQANMLWYSPEYGQVFPPLIAKTPAAVQSIDRIGTNNMLLMCNAYGKINNPKESITVLEDCLAQGAFENYQLVSAEITLAELYILNQQKEQALTIYNKYKFSNHSNYPDLTAALESLAYALETEPSSFTELLQSNRYCYSHNAFIISRYNHALSLVSRGKYQEALSHFKSIGEQGYSMILAILAMQNRPADILALKENVNAYIYRQIEHIISHYEEKLAYNHLNKLQYHIDLCMGAYCSCIPSGENNTSASVAYDFLLNTKYITLETSYLLHNTGTKLFSNEFYCTEQLMSKLPSGTALLEYTLFRSLDTVSYGMFLVSSDRIHYFEIGDFDFINSLLNKWHSLLQKSIHTSGEAQNRIQMEQQLLDSKIRKALFLPLKPYLENISRLLIAPAGALINFPFCRLSVSANKYLGDMYPIVYLNCGKELYRNSACDSYEMRIKNTGNQAIPQNTFVLGNPTAQNFPNLPFAKEEADIVAGLMNTCAYTCENATLANFLAAISAAPSILHIAAHGVFHEPPHSDNTDWDMLYHYMTQSGIIFSNNELLSYAQISNLNLSATQLAVLSCCHSGHAVSHATEGAYGLRRAFHLAGCKAVIASLWQVDDKISLLWMKSFYEALTLHSSSIEKAFIHATDTVKKQEANPYYWAGFILLL